MNGDRVTVDSKGRRRSGATPNSATGHVLPPGAALHRRSIKLVDCAWQRGRNPGRGAVRGIERRHLSVSRRYGHHARRPHGRPAVNPTVRGDCGPWVGGRAALAAGTMLTAGPAVLPLAATSPGAALVVMLCWGFAGFEPLSPRALRSAEIHNLALEHGAFSRATTKLNGPQQRDPSFLAPAESAEQLAADRG